jgi:putative ABC transport system substrate-binding protein
MNDPQPEGQVASQIERRKFLATLGGAAAAWPLAARAQQPAMPVIGYLSGLAASDRPNLMEMFRRGLGEAGFVDGRNIAIEYRFADYQRERLRILATDLIARRVAVIAATGGNYSVLVAKELTSTIPIVFTTGGDPVKAGLVGSLSRPEANVTGVSWFNLDLAAKHIELVRELVPGTPQAAVMVNPNNPETAALYEHPLRKAVRAVGMELLILNAGTPAEIDGVFEKLVQEKASVVIVSADPFYTARARQLAILAARHNLPLVSANREITMAGGLISYGNDVLDAYRRAGLYAGRILEGAKPGDLPIDRATKFDLVINLQTAKTLKLEIPAKLLARADEVIE